MFVRVVAAVGLLLCVPVASADTTDDHYLAMLQSNGVTGDPAQLISDGHAACDNYGGPGLVAQTLGLEARGLSSVQASNVILDGMRAYCPGKVPAGL